MSQERTIIGACDYSIASLENIKAALMDYGNPQRNVNWAIGGIIITLTSHLLRTCQRILLEAAQSEEANANDDLRRIQLQFNEFMDRMVNHE